MKHNVLINKAGNGFSARFQTLHRATVSRETLIYGDDEESRLRLLCDVATCLGIDAFIVPYPWPDDRERCFLSGGGLLGGVTKDAAET